MVGKATKPLNLASPGKSNLTNSNPVAEADAILRSTIRARRQRRGRTFGHCPTLTYTGRFRLGKKAYLKMKLSEG